MVKKQNSWILTLRCGQSCLLWLHPLPFRYWQRPRSQPSWFLGCKIFFIHVFDLKFKKDLDLRVFFSIPFFFLRWSAGVSIGWPMTHCAEILSGKGGRSCWQFCWGKCERYFGGKRRYENQTIRSGSDRGLSYHTHVSGRPFASRRD